MYFEIAQMLKRCAGEVKEFTPAMLAGFFGVPERHFSQESANGPILFHQAGNTQPVAYVLRGTIFWPDNRQIVRGYPRILPTSDYTPERFAITEERQILNAAREGEAVVERKESGVTIRLYHHGNFFYCATNDVYDGGNPLVGAGIENVRSLGIDYGAQAGRLLSGTYKGAMNLASIGYTPVFEMMLPELESAVPAHRPDMALIDVIDPDFTFVDRLEKERIAEDYGLKVVISEGRIQGLTTEGAFFKRLRGLEHEATREGTAGFVIKGRVEESDQAFLKVEPVAVREHFPSFPQSDLWAVYETLTEEFSQQTLADTLFVEELMLDYLGDHSRGARWQAQDFLSEHGNQPAGE
ncbi:MAG TPA: hypothetical protein VFW40_06410 [Capsulimonadaceae bacterium]|nr:hypothetical protein [Capsulimonadaceae bacterium]